MKFRNLDAGGDWTFGKGLNDYREKDEAIGLNIRTRINSWKNDCFFDEPAGIDWKNRLGSKNQRKLLERDLLDIILKSDGVVGINSFTTTIIDRNFTANYDIKTVNSQSFIDEVEVAI